MAKKVFVMVVTHDEFYDECIDCVRSEFSDDMVAKIKKLSNVVIENEVAFLSIPNEPDELLVIDPLDHSKVEEYAKRVECVQMNISGYDFYWSGYYRNTDISWESCDIPISELDNEDDYVSKE